MVAKKKKPVYKKPANESRRGLTPGKRAKRARRNINKAGGR